MEKGVDNSHCENCALRLYNTKSYNLQGVGNPWSSRVILVPNVDYKAYKGKDMEFSSQVKIIKDVLLPFTGEIESNLYILPLIRCNESIACSIDDAVYRNCLKYWANDLKTYDFKDILLLGSAVDRFLNISIHENLDTVFLSPNRRKYFVDYSPLIKYVDDDKFNVFKDYLIKWYRSSITQTYYYYMNFL